MSDAKKVEPVKQPEPVKPEKKAAPDDDIVETIDDFLANMTVASLKSLRAMHQQFMAKADAAITKIDEAVNPPKKQD